MRRRNDEFRSEGWNFCGNCGKRLTNTCPGCPEREEEVQVVQKHPIIVITAE